MKTDKIYAVCLVVRSQTWEDSVAIVKASSPKEAKKKALLGNWEDINQQELVEDQIIDQQLASEYWKETNFSDVEEISKEQDNDIL
jgi:hypothetical protein|tara:strand:- start:318 stop:575 length:258 start_codon:yes stop_codon:yes gene_type:complete